MTLLLTLLVSPWSSLTLTDSPRLSLTILDFPGLSLTLLDFFHSLKFSFALLSLTLFSSSLLSSTLFSSPWLCSTARLGLTLCEILCLPLTLLFNTIFVPREPRRDLGIRRFYEHVIWWISNSVRNRAHNLFRPKCAPIPLSDSDEILTWLWLKSPWFSLTHLDFSWLSQTLIWLFDLNSICLSLTLFYSPWFPLTLLVFPRLHDSPLNSM